VRGASTARVFSRNNEEGCVCAGLARMELYVLVAPGIYPRWTPNYPGLFSSVQFSRHPIRQRRESFESSVCAIATPSPVTLQYRRLRPCYQQQVGECERQSATSSRNFAKFEDCECARVTIVKNRSRSMPITFCSRYHDYTLVRFLSLI